MNPGPLASLTYTQHKGRKKSIKACKKAHSDGFKLFIQDQDDKRRADNVDMSLDINKSIQQFITALKSAN